MFSFLEKEKEDVQKLFRKIVGAHFTEVIKSKSREKNVRSWISDTAKKGIK